MLRLHCELRPRGPRLYEAVCLENSVAALGSSPKEAKRRLRRALEVYFKDISQDINRRIAAGEVPPSDKAVRSEVRQYMQRIHLYSLRLVRWYYHHILSSKSNREEFKSFSPTGQRNDTSYSASGRKNDKSFSQIGRVPYSARMA